MNIESDKIIELVDGSQYYIIKSLELNNKYYLYAIDIVKHENVCFFEYIDECVYKVNDDDTLKKLLLIIGNDIL